MKEEIIADLYEMRQKQIKIEKLDSHPFGNREIVLPSKTYHTIEMILHFLTIKYKIEYEEVEKILNERNNKQNDQD
jgi:hypothetical protein|tara:strand:+ start:191 stop:418 length:228 start_codon:yes stop_codon:yes gene_type:complete